MDDTGVEEGEDLLGSKQKGGGIWNYQVRKKYSNNTQSN